MKANAPNRRLDVLRKTAAALHKVGALDKSTMRDIEAYCLTKVQPLSGSEILALREREGVSQAILARHLNVGTKLVSDWERGAKRPSGPSLKLLVLVRSKGLDAIACVGRRASPFALRASGDRSRHLLPQAGEGVRAIICDASRR